MAKKYDLPVLLGSEDSLVWLHEDGLSLIFDCPKLVQASPRGQFTDQILDGR